MTEKTLEVSAQLDNNRFGTAEERIRVDEFLEDFAQRHALEVGDTGTGFGGRDMQFYIPDDVDPEDLQDMLREAAADNDVTLLSVSVEED